MSDPTQPNQEQQDAPAPESFGSTTTPADISTEVKGAETPAGDQPDAGPAAADSAADQTGATPAEGAVGGEDGPNPDANVPPETPEEVDVVGLARTSYEIPADVTDGLVVEFLQAYGGGANELRLGEWSTELLLAVLQGKFRFPEAELKNLIVVYRQRVELPAAWNDQSVINFLRTGQEPKLTSTNVWLVDVTRSGRTPAEWSTAELEAWAKGEIQAGGKSHDNGVALELKARLGLKSEDSPKSVRKAYRALSPEDLIKIAGAEASTPVVVDAASDETEQLQQAKAVVAKLETVEGLSSVDVAMIDDGLKRFIEATPPNRNILEDRALKAQNDLDTLFQYIISREPQGMVAGLERLKVTFKQQMVKGGVFDFNNVFRFTHLMRSDNKRQQRHVGLLELMRVYFADAKEARKQCEPRQLLQYQDADKVPLLIEYFTQVA